MTLIEQLLSQTSDGKKELIRQELIVSVTEQIWEAMEKAKLNKADLARMLGKSKGHVTQLLSGERNMTLATLADLAAAIGVKAQVRLESVAAPGQIRSATPIVANPINWSTVISVTTASDNLSSAII